MATSDTLRFEVGNPSGTVHQKVHSTGGMAISTCTVRRDAATGCSTRTLSRSRCARTALVFGHGARMKNIELSQGAVRYSAPDGVRLEARPGLCGAVRTAGRGQAHGCACWGRPWCRRRWTSPRLRARRPLPPAPWWLHRRPASRCRAFLADTEPVSLGANEPGLCCGCRAVGDGVRRSDRRGCHGCLSSSRFDPSPARRRDASLPARGRSAAVPGRRGRTRPGHSLRIRPAMARAREPRGLTAFPRDTTRTSRLQDASGWDASGRDASGRDASGRDASGGMPLAECLRAECLRAGCLWAECPRAECLRAECLRAECLWAECLRVGCLLRARCLRAPCRLPAPLPSSLSGGSASRRTSPGAPRRSAWGACQGLPCPRTPTRWSRRPTASFASSSRTARCSSRCRTAWWWRREETGSCRPSIRAPTSPCPSPRRTW